MASFEQWQGSRAYPGGDAPFRGAETAGPAPFAHDALDRMRMSWRSTPDAQYPSGYLGTINSRRQDRLLQGLKARHQVKHASRGVHKGEKREPSDYLWPEEFHPFLGLELQSMGVKYAPPGLGQEVGAALANDGRPNANYMPTVKGVPARNNLMKWGDPNTARGEQLRRLAPPWGGPGMAVPYPGR
jgi:hypothetical protein